MTYRISALGRAALTMWRGWRVVLPVVVANALLQSLLAMPDGSLEQGALLTLLAVLSAVAFLFGYAFIGASALLSPRGPVRWTDVRRQLAGTLAPYALWALILLLATGAAMVLHRGAALLLHAVTVFVLIAALDGKRNPLAANVRAIGRRFWRWLVTAAITTAVIGLGIGFAGVTMFFLRAPLGALVVWLVAGLLVSWMTTAWALIYLKRDPDVAPDAAGTYPERA